MSFIKKIDHAKRIRDRILFSLDASNELIKSFCIEEAIARQKDGWVIVEYYETEAARKNNRLTHSGRKGSRRYKASSLLDLLEQIVKDEADECYDDGVSLPVREVATEG